MNTETPPFAPNQKVICVVGDEICGIKKGNTYIVLSCFKECCWWHIDIGVIATFSQDLVCGSCNKYVLKIRKGKPLSPQAICFRAVQDQYIDMRIEIAESMVEVKEVPDKVRVKEVCES